MEIKTSNLLNVFCVQKKYYKLNNTFVCDFTDENVCEDYILNDIIGAENCYEITL